MSLSRAILPRTLSRCELCSYSAGEATRLARTSRQAIAGLHTRSTSRAAVLPNPPSWTARLNSATKPGSSSSRHSISNTPKWCEEGISAARDRYEAKYAERLKQKAKEQGFEDVDELKRKALQELKLNARAKDILSRPRSQKSALNHKNDSGVQSGAKPQAHEPANQSSENAATTSTAAQPATPPKAASARSSKSPVQPLSDILDLPKLLPQSADAIATIWNGFHQMQGPDSRTLSAVIPYDIYKKMEELGRQYPHFVVPLPREVLDEQGEKREGAEIHFLQWAFLPRDEANPNVPPISTVLYTPLALFKSQQNFAQPHVILTHYADLVPSHGIVLMRGDVSENVSTTPADAQLLILRLQQFYQDKNETRAKLLRQFHHEQENFDVEELIKSTGAI